MKIKKIKIILNNNFLKHNKGNIFGYFNEIIGKKNF